MELNFKLLWSLVPFTLAVWIAPEAMAESTADHFWITCGAKTLCQPTQQEGNLPSDCAKVTPKFVAIETKSPFDPKSFTRKNLDFFFNSSDDQSAISNQPESSNIFVFVPQGNFSCAQGFLARITEFTKLNGWIASLLILCEDYPSDTPKLDPIVHVFTPSSAASADVFKKTPRGATCTLGKTESGSQTTADLNSFSKTSVLFVSISFIILMVISLAWLLFYYVQRFRYAHAKDRLARRLFNAAKKALTKIPAKTLKPLDKELDADCPVCIEPYRTNDVIRILPCRHVFHKTCVDPWLLEHRTCPMCKMDILKAFGYQFCHSEDSVQHLDGDQLSGAPSTTDGRNSFPLPLSTESDLHDPFLSSPAPSPSYVQPVLHQSNAMKGYAIIPLSVHGQHGRGSDSSDSSYHFTGYSHKFHRGASAEIHQQRQNSTSSAECSSNSSSLQAKRRSNSGASRTHQRPPLFKSTEAVMTPPSNATTIVANSQAFTQPLSLTRVVQMSNNPSAVVKLGQRSYSLPGGHSDSPMKCGSAAKYFGVDSSSVDSV